MARRSRNKTAEQQPAVAVEELHQRTGPAVSVFCSWTTAIRLIDVGKDRAEASHRCANSSIRAGNEEKRVRDIASDRSE